MVRDETTHDEDFYFFRFENEKYGKQTNKAHINAHQRSKNQLLNCVVAAAAAESFVWIVDVVAAVAFFF